MRLVKLELKNYCQHADVSVDFTGNLCGIVGANGSGKSNLLGAVYFALTNDNPNNGKKQENIRAGTAENDPCYVRLHFEHNGAVGLVTRYLRTGVKSKLTLAGRGFLEGDTAVTNAIMEMLGVDQATLRQLVIVSQDSLYGVLSEAAAVRTKLYQRLFQVDRAEKIHSLLRDEVLQNQPNFIDEAVDTAGNLAAALAAKETAFATLNALGDTSEYSKVRDGLLTELSTLKNERQQLSAAVQTRQALNNAERRLDALVSQLPDLRLAEDNAEAAHVIAQSEFNAQEVLRQQAEQAQRSENHRLRLEKEIASKQQALDTISLPDVNLQFYVDGALITPENVESLRATCSTLQHDIASKINLRTQLQQEVSGACPLCKTPAEQITARNQNLDEEIAGLQKQLLSIGTGLNNYLTHAAHVELAANKMLELAREIQVLQGSLSLVEQVAVVAYSEELHTNSRQKLHAAHQAVASARQAKAGVEQEVKQLEGQISGFKTSLATVKADKTDADYAAAIALCEQRVLEYAEKLEARAKATEAYHHACMAYTSAKLAADHAAAVRAQANTRLRVQEHFKQLAAVYHYDAAPKDLTQQKLTLCQDRLNIVLSEFGAKFSVVVREDLSFDCVFPDKVQPAHRLSCGQRVVLALCLRIALVTALLPEVGLLMLDEPTTFLDADTIKAFNSALEKLREFAVAANIQVVVVTHCNDLIPAFDGVIQL